MKTFLKSSVIVIFFVIVGPFIYSVEASCNLKSIGNATLSDSVCSIDASTVEGADIAANETSTTNTASITLSNSTITIAATGATLAAGSVIITDGSSSMSITGGQYLGGNGVWVPDADADGWLPASFSLYTATASGRRRLGLMRSIATSDCSDSSYSLANGCVTCYLDNDGDSKGNPSITQERDACETPGVAGRYITDNSDCNDSISGHNYTLNSSYYPDSDLDGITGTVTSAGTARCSSQSTWDASTAVSSPGSASSTSFTVLTRLNAIAGTDCDDSWASTRNRCTSTALGDGYDGAVAINSVNKIINTQTIASGRSYADGIAYRVVAPADSATSVSRYLGTVTLSNGIEEGDEVLLINLQGTSSDYADVGNYEFMIVKTVTASTITFTSAISKSFNGTTASNQKVIVQRVPNYTNLSITATLALASSAYDGLVTTPSGAAGYRTGIVAFRANGTVTINGSITSAVRGFAGAPTSTSACSDGGESFCGTGGGTGASTAANGGAGSCGGGGGGGSKASPGTSGGAGSATGGAGGSGGKALTTTSQLNGSGGGGGYGSAAVAGKVSGVNGSTNTSGDGGGGIVTTDPSAAAGGGGGGGGTYGIANLTKLFHGSGGGAGCYLSSLEGGAGGNGGGIIYITGNSITVHATAGTVTADGDSGVAGTTYGASYSGAGGGGAGGSIYILGNSVTLNTTRVHADYGAAGGTNAGRGGNGRIAVGAGSVSGTTSPTYTAISAP